MAARPIPHAPPPPLPRPLPHVDGVHHRFVDVGVLRMHYAEAGEGEPLVMLHGWPQHWYMWRHQIQALSQHFHVICPDLRGHGWTDAPPAGYDKKTLAADVLRLLDVLGLERVRLMGHDWGGWCGFLISIEHPQRVERYLAFNIPLPYGKTDLRTIAASWRFWYMAAIASPFGASIVRKRSALLRYILRETSSHKEVWTDEVLDAYIDVLREPARARASQLLYRTFLTREFPQLAAHRYVRGRLTVPSKLVFGVDDFAISPAFLRGYEPYVDDFKLEKVPDTGHFIAEERPELVNQRALQFFGVT